MYTIRPPRFTSLAPFSSTCRWSLISLLQLLFSEPPLGVGFPPPRPRPRARRIDQHTVEGSLASLPPSCAASTSTFLTPARVSRSKIGRNRKRSVSWATSVPSFCIMAAKRQRLAAGARANVGNHSRPVRAREQCRHLRGRILHFIPAKAMGGFGLHIGIARVMPRCRNPHGAGRQRPSHCAKPRQCLQHRSAIAFQRVDPQIDGRAQGECRPLFRRAFAESLPRSSAPATPAYRPSPPAANHRAWPAPAPQSRPRSSTPGPWVSLASSATCAAVRPQRSTNAASTSARGRPSPMRADSELRLRKAIINQRADGMAIRDPAKRCALPQSFSASEAGRWRSKMSFRISIAAATRPARRMF